MLRLILKNPLKTSLTRNALITGKITQFGHPGSKIPVGILKTNYRPNKLGERLVNHQSSLYVLGLLGGATVAVASAVTYADMTEASVKNSNKGKKYQTVSQQQVMEAYEILKKEMSLPAKEGKMDEWDQLIFVVKAAIQIKECKEQLAKMRKHEEEQLQESIASDQALRLQAEVMFRNREKDVREQFRREFENQVTQETARAKEKLKQLSKQIKEASAIELEHDVSMQRAMLAKDMIEKFNKLREETEQVAEQVETTLIAKHRDLEYQENTLQENKLMVEVRNQCRDIECALSTEMAPGKKWSDQLCSLAPLVESMVHAFPPQDELAYAVLNILPPETVERGVLTEVALKERFTRVERIAQRLAMLRQDGPHPGTMYLVSYLRSMLTMQTPDSPSIQPELLMDIDNAELLYRARHCVEGGDLGRAVRFLERLQGAPRSVVAGWLQEARMLLQARQATQVLKSYTTLLIQRSDNSPKRQPQTTVCLT